MELSSERWSQSNIINNFSVSDYGRIKNSSGRIRKLAKCRQGYSMLVTKVDGITKAFRVHRLVANEFVKKINGKNIINHIDGDKSNNHYLNLEWCTSKENNIHAVKIGIAHRAKGEECGNSSLTNELVRLIIKSRLGCREFARKYNLTHTQVSSVRTGKTWNHITKLPRHSKAK